MAMYEEEDDDHDIDDGSNDIRTIHILNSYMYVYTSILTSLQNYINKHDRHSFHETWCKNKIEEKVMASVKAEILSSQHTSSLSEN